MLRKLLFLLCYAILASGCSSKWHDHQPQSEIKNVIMIIGDGMGPQQVGLLLSYARQAPQSIIKEKITAFDRLIKTGQLSISLTHAADTLVWTPPRPPRN